jgi:hypothetical protein
MSLADLEVVFIIGSPRSGTTWLQNMLGSHEEIAALPEAFIFSRYVRSLEWEFKRFGMGNSREPFERAVSLFVEEMYRTFLARKPTARVVTDKTPEHAMFAGMIEDYVPRARFVHLLRDGRDSVASMLRAGSSKGWAPGWTMSTTEAAATWKKHVVAAREPRRAPFLEVRYEELVGTRGPGLLGEILTFCGVSTDQEQAAAIYEGFSLERDGGAAVTEGRGLTLLESEPAPWPEGFVGGAAARSGAWRTELNWRQRLAVERELGPRLRELGYADGGWPGVGRLGVAGSRALGAVAALRDRARPSLERLRFLSRWRSA